MSNITPNVINISAALNTAISLLNNVKEKTVDLNLASGNQTVQDGYYQYQESPVDVPGDINYYFSKVIINKPATLVASNSIKLTDKQIQDLLSYEFQALMLLEENPNNKWVLKVEK